MLETSHVNFIKFDNPDQPKVNLISIGNLLVEERTYSGCYYHRIGSALEAFGENIPKAKNKVLWLSRHSVFPIKQIVEFKKAGHKVIVDQDDHFILSPNHVLKEMYRKQGMVERFKALLEIADVVTVTNSYLASQLTPYAKGEVVVVPNALAFDKGQFSLNQDFESGTALTYVGGNTHLHDLELVRKALPLSELTIAGVNKGCAVWQEVTKRFKGVSTKDQQPLDSYMELYSGHKIALAPLEKNVFNACKSNLKVLEAGARGLPIVCSRVHPYLNEIDKDVVLYGNSEHSWRTVVHKLLKDDEYRKDKALELAAHVRQHYQLDDANKIRRQIIESL